MIRLIKVYEYRVGKFLEELEHRIRNLRALAEKEVAGSESVESMLRRAGYMERKLGKLRDLLEGFQSSASLGKKSALMRELDEILAQMSGDLD